MEAFEYKEFWGGNLPHRHPPGATLFVTFRLDGSVPKHILRLWLAEKQWLKEETARLGELLLADDTPELKQHEERLLAFQRKWFRKFEDVLHAAQTGPRWLAEEKIAALVANSLHWRDGKVYRLDAYCIMSNHVHVVFAPFLTETSLHALAAPDEDVLYESTEPPLDVIMHSLKSYTSNQANALLQRAGTFWARESYDHVIRDAGEYDRVVNYVLNNPVKAGLVTTWHDWPWNWKRETVQQAASLLGDVEADA
ncbi:MAG: hypothetical protein HYR56_01560 [Acidobacteria bacterium]|nr:hypothetical protein [Acidobacteriota bacterium]MBI3427084.1 hypothetical protein [Acidobacteriota bacterium]